MLKELINKNSVNGSIEELIVAVRQGIPSAVFGVNDSFKCYLVSKIEDPVLMVVRDDLTANAFADMIKAYGKKKVVSLCSKDEILVLNRAFSKDRLYKRIVAINNLIDADCIVATPDSLMQVFPKKTFSLTFEKNKDYLREEYLIALVKMGYKRVESIEGQGTFSIRGDILDIYPINMTSPVKIDFFGDTVDGIKVYDLATREKLANPKSVEILQAVEVTFSGEDFQKIYFEVLKETRAFKGNRDRIKEIADAVEFSVKEKDADALSVFSAITSSVSDFTSLINKNTVVVIDEGKRVKSTAELTEKEFNERYKTLLSGGEIFSFEKDKTYKTSSFDAGVSEI
jgi:transcription-repair coupling factor (superfamily II helicase)